MHLTRFSHYVHVQLDRDEWFTRSMHERAYLVRQCAFAQLQDNIHLSFTLDRWDHVRFFFPELVENSYETLIRC